jgi:hypothetical protein
MSEWHRQWSPVVSSVRTWFSEWVRKFVSRIRRRQLVGFARSSGVGSDVGLDVGSDVRVDSEGKPFCFIVSSLYCPVRSTCTTLLLTNDFFFGSACGSGVGFVCQSQRRFARGSGVGSDVRELDSASTTSGIHT